MGIPPGQARRKTNLCVHRIAARDRKSLQEGVPSVAFQENPKLKLPHELFINVIDYEEDANRITKKGL